MYELATLAASQLNRSNFEQRVVPLTQEHRMSKRTFVLLFFPYNLLRCLRLSLPALRQHLVRKWWRRNHAYSQQRPFSSY